MQGGYAGSGSLSLDSLTFSGSGAVNVSALGIAYTSSPAIAVGTDVLSTAGVKSVAINVGSIAGATLGVPYEMIGYNSLAGAGTSAFYLGAVANRGTGTLSFAPGLIELTITGTDYLHWTGTASTAGIRPPPTGSSTPAARPRRTSICRLPRRGLRRRRRHKQRGEHRDNGLPRGCDVQQLQQQLLAARSREHSRSRRARQTLNGPGTVTLATANSYAGGTTLAGGLLNLANSAALGSGASRSAAVRLTTPAVPPCRCRATCPRIGTATSRSSARKA